ncbi:MAG: glycoside hydrolase family 26 protein [Solirubrobacterales bacterium]
MAISVAVAFCAIAVLAASALAAPAASAPSAGAGAAMPEKRPSVFFHPPRQAPAASRVLARGRVTGLAGRAVLQAQLRRGGRWRTVARTRAAAGRFRIAVQLPKRGRAAVLRGALLAGNHRLAVSRPRRVQLDPRQPASPAAPTPTPIPIPTPNAEEPPATAAGSALAPPVLPPPPPPPSPPPSPPPAEPEAPIAPPDYALWGGYIDPGDPSQPAPVNPAAIAAFEAKAGKPPSLLESFSAFAECDSANTNCSYIPFPQEQLEAIRGRGAVPFFTWASEATSGEVDQPNFQLADVIEGKYDGYIADWANAARAWGHPFFLRFDWEMNGNWYPWGESVNGNAPGQYVEAWWHVHEIFTTVGATNATWVWCPYINPNGNLQPIASLYPGDEYVDWTCLDGYNYGTSKSNTKWRSFDYLFGPQYAEIVGSIAPTKPMLIAEVASSELGGSKAAWIAEMLAELPTAFPAVQGLMWFDYLYEGNDWWLASSPAAEQAFAAGIADPRYVANILGGLAISPIPAP